MQADTKRRRPSAVKSDRKVLQALKDMEEYNPSSADISISALEASSQNLENLYEVETQKEKASKAARDNSVAGEHAFHELIIRAKKQVLAQFGESSNEAQSVGLKKKSEYKPPKRKPKKGNNE